MPNKGYSGAEKVVIQIITHLSNEYEFAYISQDGLISEYLRKNQLILSIPCQLVDHKFSLQIQLVESL